MKSILNKDYKKISGNGFEVAKIKQIPILD